MNPNLHEHEQHNSTDLWSMWRWIGELLLAIMYGICNAIIALAIIITLMAIALSNSDYFNQKP